MSWFDEQADETPRSSQCVGRRFEADGRAPRVEPKLSVVWVRRGVSAVSLPAAYGIAMPSGRELRCVLGPKVCVFGPKLPQDPPSISLCWLY